MSTDKRLVGWGVVFLPLAVSCAFSGDLRLVFAAKNNDTQMVRSLLKQHMDVNISAPDGATALSWSVHWDAADSVDLLIRAGANVNAANDYGIAPLWLACSNANGGMVETLLKAGAKPNPERGGETALMRCARTGSLKGVNALLEHGAQVNVKENRQEQTALMWAVAEKHSDVTRVLIKQGSDIRSRSKGGFTPLLFAARSGDLDSAKALLEAGANANDAAPNGLTALLVASASGHEAVSVLLVENGADPNAADGNGMTALHYAVLKGLSIIRGVVYEPEMAYLLRPDMPQLAQALLAHGANPNVRITKEIPLVARQRNRQYARTLGATPFLLAAAAGNTDIMRLLASRGADPLQATNEKLTPLMAAAGVGQIYGNRTKEEATHALEAVKLAVELGADVNAVDSKGSTAVHGAAYRGANDIIQYLVDKGARLDLMDKYGHTPLGIAEGDLNILRDERERRRYPSAAALIRKLGGDTLGTGAAVAAANSEVRKSAGDAGAKQSASGPENPNQ